MKIRFVYGTDEWAKICESINLYLQYCHDMAHIKIDMCNYTKKENPCCDVLNADDIVVVPLFEKGESEIKSKGLDIVKYLRGKNGYKFNTIFLVLSKRDIPDYLHPENVMHYYAEKMLGNPKFEDEDKAVFFGEIIYKNKKKEPQNEKSSYEDMECTNIINFQEHDALTRLAKLIKQDIKLPSIDEDLRESYCSTFIEYYECKGEDGKNVLNKESKKTLAAAQEMHNSLNHPDIETSSHAVPYELFLAPVPFPLQDLFDAKLEIRDELSKYNNKNKIKLLLLDNRSDNKFITQSDDKNPQAGPLCYILNKFGLDELFEIEMLGNTVFKKNVFSKENKEINDYSNFEKEFEEFNFRWFKYDKELNNKTAIEDDEATFWKKYYKLKNYHKKFLEECKKKGIELKTYSDIIYNKIKSSHFVLLDFFLNDENTYLAFDFIKDIDEIKKNEGDYFTTWYFITSAVYDSVVKYSQSGLLAEYYESAVVNAGDDPTNKKRQIIFIYKLLTFIQARIKSFKRFHDSIVVCKLLNCEKKDCTDKGARCLTENQNLFRKYLGEYGEITKIFPGQEKAEKEFKKTVELLNSTVNQFMWLPEADWPMVQRQIDHINLRLKNSSDLKGSKFSCSFINNEIDKRSNIY